MTYKIITGCNDLYILTLIDFLDYHINIGINISNIIVYDFGINNENLNLILIKYPTITIKNIDYSLYPDFVNPQLFFGLNCSYAFKVIAIYLECQQNAIDNLIWMDSANRACISSIIQIINAIKQQGFYCPMSSQPNTIESLELHHITCLETMKVLNCDYNNLYQVGSGLVGLNYANDVGKNIIDNWYKFSLIKNAICPDNSSRNNHRQDQSILSILMYQYEQQHNMIFIKQNFGVHFWIKKDKITIDSKFKPFYLFSKTTNKQLATIHCENLEEAQIIYSDRKKITIDNLLQEFIVK